MADIQLSPNNGRRKTAAPRVDLTPMVDLGFLLITFFMFTTALAKPKTMQLDMPYPGTPEQRVAWPEEATVTIIPVGGHRVIFYSGNPGNPQQPVLCALEGKGGLRERIIAAKRAVAALPAHLSPEAHQLHVLIRPDASSTYGDVVNVLDEMSIHDITWYSMTDPAPEEKDWIRNFMAYGK
jgi:biopolymer transport protein ExbD